MNRNQNRGSGRYRRSNDSDGFLKTGGGLQNRNFGLLGDSPIKMQQNFPTVGSGLGILGSGPSQNMGNVSGRQNTQNLGGGMQGMNNNSGMQSQRSPNLGNRNQNLSGSSMNSSISSINQSILNLQHQINIQQQKQLQHMAMRESHQQQKQASAMTGSGMRDSPQQQQQNIAAIRDSQLQMVNSLLQQQGMGGQGRTGGMSGLMSSPQSNQGQGLLGNAGTGNLQQGLMGSKPNFLQGRQNIPSIFEINTSKAGILGKRRFGGNDRNMMPKRQRRPSQGRTPDHSFDRDSDQRSRNFDRRRPSSRDSSSKRSEHSSPSFHNKNDRRESVGSGSNSSFQMKDVERQPEVYDPAKPTEEDDSELNYIRDDQETDDMPMDDKQELDSSFTAQSFTSDDDKTHREDGSMEDLQQKKEDTTKMSNFYCHACSAECRDQQGFANHMKGQKHRMRMESILNLHKQKSTQLEARMKAEEHLRRIEGKPKSDDRRKSDGDKDIIHKGSRDSKHQRSVRDRYRRRSSRDRSEEEEDIFPDDLGELVTLDTVGFEDDGQEIDEQFLDNQFTESFLNNQDKDIAALKDKDQYSGAGDKEDKEFSIPDYEPNSAVGQNFVVAVSGFFCKLCHKFYNTETAAKTKHCQSQPHYEKFKKAMKAKMLSKRMQDDAVKKNNESSDVIQSTDDQEMSSATENQGVESRKLPGLSNDQDVLNVSQDEQNPEICETQEPDGNMDILSNEVAEDQAKDLLETRNENDLCDENEDNNISGETVTSPKVSGRGGSRGRGKRGRRGRR